MAAAFMSRKASVNHVTLVIFLEFFAWGSVCAPSHRLGCPDASVPVGGFASNGSCLLSTLDTIRLSSKPTLSGVVVCGARGVAKQK